MVQEKYGSFSRSSFPKGLWCKQLVFFWFFFFGSASRSSLVSFGLSMVSRTWAELGPALALPQPVPGAHNKIVETVLR